MATVTAKEIPVEKLLNKEEAKKDFAVLSELQSKLPSDARVKIFKRKEDGGRDYISSLPAQDLINVDIHDFIKKKYAKKHGGGEYVIEAIDSDGNTVMTSTISIAEELTEEQKAKQEEKLRLKEHEEIMQMREEAFQKLKEAEEEKRKAEKMRWEAYIEALNKQWETMQKMYEEQIKTLKEYINSAPDPTTQMMFQMQLDKVSREFENARRDFELKIKEAQERSATTDKFYDLVSQLIPQLISISTEKGKDPVEEFSKVVNVIKNTIGEKKDLIESFLENPEKLRIFQRLLGIDSEEKKKGLLDELMENTEKLKVFQRLLGIDDDQKRKSFWDELIEKPEKIKTFQKLLGLEEKKDFFTELIEKPEKFELFKKIIGIDKTEELIKHLQELKERQRQMENEIRSKPEEPKKDLVDQILEAKQKFEALKGLFAPPQPAKTFIELVSQLLTSAGPYIVQAMQQYISGMITLEMLRKGINPQQIMNMPQLQQQITQGQLPQGQTPQLENLSGISETKQIEGFAGSEMPEEHEEVEQKAKRRGRKKVRVMPVEEAFAQLVAEVAKSTSQDGTLNEEAFIDTMAKGIMANLEIHPEWGIEALKKYGKALKEKGAEITSQVLAIEIDKAKELINKIGEKFLELRQ